MGTDKQESLGARIRRIRLDRGLSVDKLAEKLNKSRASIYIYRYEGEDVENMPIGVLVPLAKALGMTPIELLGWDDDKTDKQQPEMGMDFPEPVVQAFNDHKMVWEHTMKKKMLETFSKNVQSKLDLDTVSKFARATGVDKAQAGDLMAGRPVQLSKESIKRIAKFFSVSEFDLFFNDLSKLNEDGPKTKNIDNEDPHSSADTAGEEDTEKILGYYANKLYRIYLAKYGGGALGLEGWGPWERIESLITHPSFEGAIGRVVNELDIDDDSFFMSKLSVFIRDRARELKLYHDIWTEEELADFYIAGICDNY